MWKKGHSANYCNNSRDRKDFFAVTLTFGKETDLSPNEIKFYLDSGATDHIVNEKIDFFYNKS